MDNIQKVVALYKYIKELCSLKYKVVKDIGNQYWSCTIKDIPIDDDNISISFRDRVAEDSGQDDVIVQVKKPDFQACPSPPNDIKTWLNDGWDSYYNDVQIKKSLKNDKTEDRPENDREVFFNDSKERINNYNIWKKSREEWALKQRIIAKTRKFFLKLYQMHTDLERDSETLELMIGNGILKDQNNTSINHPVMLKRAKFEFDASENIMKIIDTDAESELYTMLLQDIPDINHNVIKQLKEDLKENFYHPLDRNDTPDYLKILLHRICGQSKFMESNSETDISAEDRLLMYLEPVFFIRKRVDGSLKTIEEIIKIIEETSEVPKHLIELVGAGDVEVPTEDHEPTIDELLAATSGENSEILLAKEANREQLEIAERIEKYNAVLVQGPPGTGKTHTIANLLGHFLAQGKSVLVTSHTKKALSVLKEKVPEGIKNLCVTVLDDTNKDMENSIDGISEYLSKYTSNELKKKMESTKNQRLEMIKQLAEARRKVYSAKYREFEPIVYDGDSFSPAAAAEFVDKNAAELSYIPGMVKLNHSFPLTNDEIISLFRSNNKISANDETELKLDIPNPNEIISPEEFKSNILKRNDLNVEISKISEEINKRIIFKKNSEMIVEDEHGKRLLGKDINIAGLMELLKYIETFNQFEEWMLFAVVDGKKGSGFRQRWDLMIELIDEIVDFAQSFVAEKMGKQISFLKELKEIDFEIFEDSLNKMEKLLIKNGKLTRLDLLINKNVKSILNMITINDALISSLEDCNIVQKQLSLMRKRNKLSKYWDELMSNHALPSFFELDLHEPERICKNMIPQIKRYLDWYTNEYDYLIKLTDLAGFDTEKVFVFSELDTEVITIRKLLEAVNNDLKKYIIVAEKHISIFNLSKIVSESLEKLRLNQRKNSKICSRLYTVIENEDYNEYFEAYKDLTILYNKHIDAENRKVLLDKLETFAPEWSYAIKERNGIFGDIKAPENIMQAWKWKQFDGIIEEITSEPFEEIQNKCIVLSKELRNKTAKLAKYSAWYNLLLRTEKNLDMRQSLQGWKKTVKKIGKGTGKNAPMLKKEARELMAKCQKAVPAWIMPVNKALENLNPAENSFDIIIVDEASQSDISALAIVFMGKKIIIVGDDKQVSPMAVGIDIDRMNALIEMYIKELIPNWHLYDAKSSLYDIAGTTFQPLMLREHFRCVPEIIGYSNKMSYDFKIKPLRDASTCNISPSVINYRVLDGARLSNKTNKKEAETIVSLLLSCLEQKEYEGKTFGIISLLGDEQAQFIQQLIFDKIDAPIIEERKILCGNASHFQGDQRHVIFLSMVDSNQDSEGPLFLAGVGSDQSRKQRYNVAASRAKDQMWVIHSIDSTRDLKAGDLRKDLLEYSNNPIGNSGLLSIIEKKADSAFEEMVAKSLVGAGYHIVQQWEVGAYKIDMVAIYANKKIAIECDGELYHSGYEKIKEDMERQTILERLGWRFIRIRGSEYFRNPDETIKRVIKNLNDNDILPESIFDNSEMENTSELLNRVKVRASQIIDDWNSNFEVENKTDYFVDEDLKKESRVQNKLEIEKNEKEENTYEFSKPNNIISINKPKEKKNVISSENPFKRNEKMQKEKVNTVNKDISSKYSEVCDLLRKKNAEYIDRSLQSGIIWVIYDSKHKEVVNDICSNCGVKVNLEWRGSIATDNRPAWLIKI
jgi:superfamily I DNA and/or RNA helicase